MNNMNEAAGSLYALAEEELSQPCDDPSCSSNSTDQSTPRGNETQPMDTSLGSDTEPMDTSASLPATDKSGYESPTSSTASPDSSSKEATSSSDGPPAEGGGEDDNDNLWEDINDIAKNACSSQSKQPDCSESSQEKDEGFDFLVSLCKWQTKHNVSESGLASLLQLVEPMVDKNSVHNFPTSLHSLYKKLDIDCDNFTKYIVCPECTKIYEYREIVREISPGKVKVTKCTNKPFETGKLSKVCNTTLVREQIVKKKTKYVPLKYFCYKSMIDSLHDMLKRPGVVNKCKEWCDRDVPHGVYSDVYDGDVWQNFGKTKKNKDGFFTRNEHTYGFSLNIDWFQPYKHRPNVSVGVMYLVLLNLPREERYKRENWVVCGIVPNLKKEPSSMEHFLRPLVDEVKVLYNGLRVDTSEHSRGVNIRAALIMVTCDIPAARKTCGFLGHSAKLGCSKCLKQFSGTVGSMNYSGTDVRYWPRRTVRGHRNAVTEMRKKVKSKTRAKSEESKCGYRYTPLLDLSYFDTVKFCTIDSMHCLFTGIAKTICSRIWIQRLELFSKEDLAKIDERLEKLSNASENNWRPKSFSSLHSSWTAYEWKSWILTYSLYALKGILDDEHYNVWHTFVVACQFLVKPTVTKADIEAGHAKLVDFVRQATRVYGPDAVTPNMHMCMHMREDMLNYSSLYATWLFPYERFNFVVGSTLTNGKSIEVQLMRSVEKYKQLVSMSNNDENVGSKMSVKYHSLWPLLCPDGDQDICESLWSDVTDISLPKKDTTFTLPLHSQEALLGCYRKMYPGKTIHLSDLTFLCSTYDHIFMANTKYASSFYSRSSKRYGGVLASWNDGTGNVSFDTELQPCKIVRYIKHCLYDREAGVKKSHIFAMVRWYLPYRHGSDYPQPMSTWEASQYAEFGPASFLPVQRISSKFVWALNDKYRLVISPIPSKINM